MFILYYIDAYNKINIPNISILLELIVSNCRSALLHNKVHR